jgi:hypothetical protein
VGFSPDGKHVVSGSMDNTICIWDAETGELTAGPIKHEYITLSHIFRSDSDRNPESDRNFWNSWTFHLHIFPPILCNSDRTGVEFYPRNPWNPPGLNPAFSSRINRNPHSRLLPPPTCDHHTVTRDCHLTTTTIHDAARLPTPPAPSHLSPPLTATGTAPTPSHSLPSRPNGDVRGCEHATSHAFFGRRQLSTRVEGPRAPQHNVIKYFYCSYLSFLN